MALSPKQEKFCRNIAEGKSGKDSYLDAYETKCIPQVAYNEASKLLLREDIQKRIAEIRKPLEDAVNITTLTAREKQITEIKERIEICKQKDDESSLIRYLDMLNRIYSLYKDNEQTEQTSSTVNSLDISTLKRLSGAS